MSSRIRSGMSLGINCRFNDADDDDVMIWRYDDIDMLMTIWWGWWCDDDVMMIQWWWWYNDDDIMRW